MPNGFTQAIPYTILKYQFSIFHRFNVRMSAELHLYIRLILHSAFSQLQLLTAQGGKSSVLKNPR